jgi:hypothetical protein
MGKLGIPENSVLHVLMHGGSERLNCPFIEKKKKRNDLLDSYICNHRNTTPRCNFLPIRHCG